MAELIFARIGSVSAGLGFILVVAASLPGYLLWIIALPFLAILVVCVLSFFIS